MTITFAELRRDDGGLEVGTAGAVSAVRTFIVPGANESIARNDQDLNREAGIGVQHPRQSGLRVIALQVRDRLGADVDEGFYVDALYARPEFGQTNLPPPDRQNLDFDASGFTFYDTDIEIPIIVRRSIAAPGGEAYEWVKAGSSVRATVQGLRFKIEFNMPPLTMAQMQAIADQAGRIHHLFGSSPWVFRPQSADIVYRDGVQNVVFQWVWEAGTEYADLVAGGLVGADIAPIDDRPPHGVWYVGFETLLPSTSTPRVYAMVPHKVDPMGFQSLPGYGDVWNL